MNIKLSLLLVGLKEENINFCSTKASELGLSLNLNIAKDLGEYASKDPLKFDMCFFHSDFVESIYSKINSPPATLEVQKAIDCLIIKNKQTWPFFLFKSALKRLIVEKGKDLDYKSAGLIIGGGPYARSIVSVLVEMGFKKISLIIPAEKDLELYRRWYFGIEFNEFSKEQLVLQPGVHSVLALTHRFPEDDPYLDDVLYFNYLKAHSVIINFFSDGSDFIMNESKAITDLQITGESIMDSIFCLAFEKWIEMSKNS